SGFTYAVANYGKLPAIITDVQMYFALEPAYDGSLQPARDDFILRIYPVLKADQERRDHEVLVRFGDPQRDNMIVRRGELYDVPGPPLGHQFYFRLVIFYDGPFTKGHETGACYVTGAPNYLFSQYG